MTEKIYEKQSFCRELKTVVTACSKEQDSFYVMLKESIFFPEEGGQYSDTGTIRFAQRTVRVLKGELMGSPAEGETDVRYLVDGEILPGTEVLCTLDWDKRFDRMQNHSGEHILSGLLYSRYGFHNVGFHLSDTEPVTVDTDGVLQQGQVAELEREANAVIYANLPITDSYPSREELEDLQYRSKIKIRAQVRLITIGDNERTVDVCACCAPHVESTGQIGVIKILGAEKFRGGTRLSILCGRRALVHINRHLTYLEEASRIFSTSPEMLASIAKNSKEENEHLQAELAGLSEELILKDIESGAFQNTVWSDLKLGAGSMKRLYNSLIELRNGFCGIFSGNDEEGYRYYAGGKGLDARILGEQMKAALLARGGGSAEMIQGKTMASRQQIESFFADTSPGDYGIINGRKSDLT